MALEIVFKVENLGVAVESAGYTVIDSVRTVVETGFTSIDENGNCVIPITSPYIESGERVRPTIDDFNGGNFDETGTATDWVRVTPVYVDYSVTQDGYTVKCINETGSDTPWDMGDGTLIDELDPTYSYTVNGTYTITSGDFSTVVTITNIVYFNVTLIDNKVICTPQSGVLADWHFGNGDTSTDKYPEYEYYANGTYTVSHGDYSVEIVLDYYSDGLINSISDNIVLLERPDGETGSWDMGDGTITQDNEKEYAQYGRYLVGIADLVVIARITPTEFPTCSFQWSPDEVEENKVTFVANGGSRYKWVIDNVVYTDSVVTHVFANTGSYEIYCTAYTDNGNADTAYESIYVYTSNAEPVGYITMIRDELKVIFSANATDADNDALTYNWDFGDGTNSTISNPTRTYLPPTTPKDPNGQTFTITCVVTDARGLSITLTDTVTVYDGLFYGPNLIGSNNFNDGTSEGWEVKHAEVAYIEDEGRDVIHVTNNRVGDGVTQTYLYYQLAVEVGKTYEVKSVFKVIYNSGTACSISIRDNNKYSGQQFLAEYGVYTEMITTFVAETVNPQLWIQSRRYGEGEIFVDEISVREQL